MEQTVEEAERVKSGDGQTVVDERTAAPPPAARQRALTADFVRVVLFAGVVVAHSVSMINTDQDVLRSAQLVGTLLHLTRYGFVAVTLFVLVLSMRGRTMSPVQFWRRRFGLIVAPYLVWTIIYTATDHLVIAGNPFPSPGRYLQDLGFAIIAGTGKYQLYFLLISMQIYLFFPAISWLIDRTINRPWSVLSAAVAIQILVFATYQWLPRPRGYAWDQVYEHAWKALPMYTLFVAIGALMAVHLDSVQAWLRAHLVPVVISCLIGTSASVAVYLWMTAPGDVPWQATTPWNPPLLLWLVSGVVLLWLVAMVWDGLRTTGHKVGARAVSYATIRAFGVFAVHPLILDLLARAGFFGELHAWFPGSAATRTTILVIIVLALSLIVVDLLLRTPAAKWLVARDRVPLSRNPIVKSLLDKTVQWKNSMGKNSMGKNSMGKNAVENKDAAA
ncbi:acyltransferase [Gordonia sp. (in: high G+C Gram-positive bacteria)]|uniref:acyltransferase n=1 Tax=Gordonia sp. (in: high G+C Gram-positive bacteria) TaxID=84139 RepID=UPI003F997977